MQSAGTYIYRCTIHSLTRHLSDARASSVYCSYARLTIVSADMHFIVSEYVYFVHVFYDNSVHGTCIDLRSNRSIAYSQSRGCAHNRYTPPCHGIVTHLRSSIRCLVHEAHAHTHPRYTRLILVLSPRIVTRIRVIGAVILTIRHRLLARIRGEPPSQFLVQNASFSSFARVVHTRDFWCVRRHAVVLSFRV